MFKYAFVLLIVFFNFKQTQGCSALYGQCGGQTWSGPTCCIDSVCVYSNPWYSQCLQATPTGSSSTTQSPTNPPTTISSTTAAGNQGCSALYGQCGGQTWSGPTCCINSVCVYSNPWYSQCLQATPAVSSSTTQSPTNAPTTTKTTTNAPTTTTTNAPTTTKTTTNAPTTTKTTTNPPTTTSSTTAAGNQGCSALYGQCGGQTWSGPTCCINSACVYSNPWYSQCLLSGQSSSSSVTTASIITSSPFTTPNDGRQPGVTTRYWDCCKASCGWSGKASVTSPVRTCAQDGVTAVNANTQSGCNGGTAYMCTDQQPWNVSETLSYGFAAAVLTVQNEANWCCACYSLIFTSGAVVGKELIVQVTNTGGDLGNNHFDLQMPGGGVGIFDGCSSQFPGPYSWGNRYGGVSQRSDCANLPNVLQPGCYWRFDWFMNADNPSISFKQIACPSVLTTITQCIRN